jgi:hypothetical protein
VCPNQLIRLSVIRQGLLLAPEPLPYAFAYVRTPLATFGDCSRPDDGARPAARSTSTMSTSQACR